MIVCCEFDPRNLNRVPLRDSQQILSFYMSKNTPERQDYMMGNLEVTVEE